ncbi:hypothetical protein PsorP6_001817 [Peronosclerospora sorghi]|uniref:Uncharacterized protein n=1 Tax=Peronosclerospora sorghi TaxID=230839 RepID=A0ACC0WVS2_9STRA|nr:hypothetical protein PsorP6_001817 [Peronosclerospora sorghi]
MPQADDASAHASRRRAPPPPLPTSTSPPVPDAKAPVGREPPMPRAPAATEEPSKHKHRGSLIRAIGGFFKRKCSDADDATSPSDSEASERRTSRWSNWSHRQSLPERPLDATVDAEASTIEENALASSMFQMRKPLVKKVKKDKAKVTFVNAKQSPTDASELLRAGSGDESAEDGREPSPVAFLFFGGSETTTTFQPDVRPSELDEVQESAIRPMLQNKMPLFVSSSLVEPVRRSGILPDPTEYEF